MRTMIRRKHIVENPPDSSSASAPARWLEIVAELKADRRPFGQLGAEERRARIDKLHGSLQSATSVSEEFLRRKREEVELEEAKLDRAAG